MKNFRLSVAVLLASATMAATAADLNSNLQKASYAIGANMGHNLSSFAGKEIDLPSVIAGLNDAYAGKKLALDDKAMDAALKEYAKSRLTALRAEHDKLAKSNAEAGEKFLSANKAKPGVKTLADGLQIKVNKEGTGATPAAGDTVTVNYTGHLIDGTVFDSSKEHNKPATFVLESVIPGWQEGLKQMKVGGQYTLYIPAGLAYGESGAGPKIGPNSVLVFDIDLLKVDKKADAKPAQ